ncbi:MAG: FHA domain-containing protein [Planctomycetota bacterium]|nr:MAG: FHA domain-containing protein [Planctomycetota bacterium]
MPAGVRACHFCGGDLVERLHARGVAEEEEPDAPGGDGRAHFLVTSAGESIRLEPTQVFVLGRSTAADLVARSTDVSRQHAQIVWSSGAPLLQDLDARHGTFLDGQRLQPHAVAPLSHGQRIRLASNTVLFYFHVAPERVPDEIRAHGIGGITQEFALEDLAKRKTTRRYRRPTIGAASEPASDAPSVLPTRGSLDAIPGSQLLSILKAKAFSGRVSFFDGIHRGELHLVNGNVYEARMGREEGDSVVQTLANLRRGTFRIAGDVPRRGSLSRIAPDDLFCEYYEGEATGILSLFREDDPNALTGRVVFIDGLARSAGFGRLVGAAALERIGALRKGRFVFEDRSREELDGRMQTPLGQRETIRLDRAALVPKRKRPD